MPRNETLLDRLREGYGAEKGERIYYAMENEGHPATRPAAIRKARRARATRVRRSRARK